MSGNARPVSPDVLDLFTGRLEQQTTFATQPVSLGFIGSDLKYYKPTLWNEQHALGGRKLRSREYTRAIEAYRTALTQARLEHDNDLVATSLFDVASAKRQGTPADSGEIEKLYLEALQKANDAVTNSQDGADIRPKWIMFLALGTFYEEHNLLAKAQKCVEQSIAVAEKLTDDRLIAPRESERSIARTPILPVPECPCSDITSDPTHRHQS